MQAQVYEGYVEGRQFYHREIPIHFPERFRAVLTVLDVPTQTDKSLSMRLEWLDRLEAAVALSSDEELPDWAFERSKEMRAPLNLAD